MPSKPGASPKTQAQPADKPLLRVLRGERLDPPPVWMMRQAGRYLPEYRQLRADRGSFLNLVYDSDAAAEVTLQPLKRFPQLDAAILFSDILIVPFAIGQNLTFVAGEGPRLTPPLATAGLDELTAYPARLEPIYETVRKVRAALDPAKTLIGFAGSPWTVATYMSLDNVLAVAGAARDHPWILVFGLILSVILMGVAANFIARYIERYRWIAYVGLAVIVWVAGKMIWDGWHDVAPHLA